MSAHLSQDFQGVLSPFSLTAMRSLSLHVTAFPDVQARDNILSVSSSHSFTLNVSFPVRRSPQTVADCLIYVKLQHSITDQSELAPK